MIHYSALCMQLLLLCAGSSDMRRWLCVCRGETHNRHIRCASCTSVTHKDARQLISRGTTGTICRSWNRHCSALEPLILRWRARQNVLIPPLTLTNTLMYDWHDTWKLGLILLPLDSCVLAVACRAGYACATVSHADGTYAVEAPCSVGTYAVPGQVSSCRTASPSEQSLAFTAPRRSLECCCVYLIQSLEAQHAAAKLRRFNCYTSAGQWAS